MNTRSSQQTGVRTAVIDVGTLKSKFEVREYDSNYHSTVLVREKELTVLGRDLDKTDGMIVRQSIEATVKALAGFRKKMEEYEVSSYRAVTTEAIRKARNAQEVLAEISERTGITLETLDHAEEARVYFRSVSKDFPGMVIAAVDVGGGSVQVVIGKDDDIFETYLFKTGVYYMQETLSKTHHPTADELEDAKKFVHEQMAALSGSKYKPEVIVYGSTNIIDFFSAMGVAFQKNDGADHPYRVHVEQLYPVYEKIIPLCYEDRMPLFPAEPYFMWSAENALLNIFEISTLLGVTTIIPSNNNISSGILYELARSHE
jgi:exopolyphosphatase / guanosine-5'-triphosphate,3'-diphosphate pyrophosphatase